MPRVTVVMAVYNAARFLREAVASVLAQTYRDFELVVVDDSSRDDSLSILQSFVDPRMQIIRHPTNMGAALSRNDALAAARGELAAIMDADDVCLPQRFERQVGFMTAYPAVGVLGCWTEDIDENDAPYPLNAIDHPIDHHAFLFAIDAGLPLLCHPAVMFRRDVVRSVGGYHPAFSHSEDLDLWLRLGLVGLLLFTIAFIYSIAGGFRVWRRHPDARTAALALALVAVLFGLLVTAFLEPMIDEYRYATFFGVSLGMLRACVTSLERGPQSQTWRPVSVSAGALGGGSGW